MPRKKRATAGVSTASGTAVASVGSSPSCISPLSSETAAGGGGAELLLSPQRTACRRGEGGEREGDLTAPPRAAAGASSMIHAVYGDPETVSCIGEREGGVVHGHVCCSSLRKSSTTPTISCTQHEQQQIQWPTPVYKNQGEMPPPGPTRKSVRGRQHPPLPKKPPASVAAAHEPQHQQQQYSCEADSLLRWKLYAGDEDDVDRNRRYKLLLQLQREVHERQQKEQQEIKEELRLAHQHLREMEEALLAAQQEEQEMQQQLQATQQLVQQLQQQQREIPHQQQQHSFVETGNLTNDSREARRFLWKMKMQQLHHQAVLRKQHTRLLEARTACREWLVAHSQQQEKTAAAVTPAAASYTTIKGEGEPQTAQQVIEPKEALATTDVSQVGETKKHRDVSVTAKGLCSLSAHSLLSVVVLPLLQEALDTCGNNGYTNIITSATGATAADPPCIFSPLAHQRPPADAVVPDDRLGERHQQILPRSAPGFAASTVDSLVATCAVNKKERRRQAGDEGDKGKIQRDITQLQGTKRNNSDDPVLQCKVLMPVLPLVMNNDTNEQQQEIGLRSQPVNQEEELRVSEEELERRRRNKEKEVFSTSNSRRSRRGGYSCGVSRRSSNSTPHSYSTSSSSDSGSPTRSHMRSTREMRGAVNKDEHNTRVTASEVPSPPLQRVMNSTRTHDSYSSQSQDSSSPSPRREPPPRFSRWKGRPAFVPRLNLTGESEEEEEEASKGRQTTTAPVLSAPSEQQQQDTSLHQLQPVVLPQQPVLPSLPQQKKRQELQSDDHKEKRSPYEREKQDASPRQQAQDEQQQQQHQSMAAPSKEQQQEEASIHYETRESADVEEQDHGRWNDHELQQKKKQEHADSRSTHARDSTRHFKEICPETILQERPCVHLDAAAEQQHERINRQQQAFDQQAMTVGPATQPQGASVVKMQLEQPQQQQQGFTIKREQHQGKSVLMKISQSDEEMRGCVVKIPYGKKQGVVLEAAETEKGINLDTQEEKGFLVENAATLHQRARESEIGAENSPTFRKDELEAAGGAGRLGRVETEGDKRLQQPERRKQQEDVQHESAAPEQAATAPAADREGQGISHWKCIGDPCAKRGTELSLAASASGSTHRPFLGKQFVCSTHKGVLFEEHGKHSDLKTQENAQRSRGTVQQEKHLAQTEERDKQHISNPGSYYAWNEHVIVPDYHRNKQVVLPVNEWSKQTVLPDHQWQQQQQQQQHTSGQDHDVFFSVATPQQKGVTVQTNIRPQENLHLHLPTASLPHHDAKAMGLMVARKRVEALWRRQKQNLQQRRCSLASDQQHQHLQHMQDFHLFLAEKCGHIFLNRKARGTGRTTTPSPQQKESCCGSFQQQRRLSHAQGAYRSSSCCCRGDVGASSTVRRKSCGDVAYGKNPYISSERQDQCVSVSKRKTKSCCCVSCECNEEPLSAETTQLDSSCDIPTRCEKLSVSVPAGAAEVALSECSASKAEPGIRRHGATIRLANTERLEQHVATVTAAMAHVKSLALGDATRSAQQQQLSWGKQIGSIPQSEFPGDAVAGVVSEDVDCCYEHARGSACEDRCVAAKSRRRRRDSSNKDNCYSKEVNSWCLTTCNSHSRRSDPSFNGHDKQCGIESSSNRSCYCSCESSNSLASRSCSSNNVHACDKSDGEKSETSLSPRSDNETGACNRYCCSCSGNAPPRTPNNRSHQRDRCTYFDSNANDRSSSSSRGSDEFSQQRSCSGCMLLSAGHRAVGGINEGKSVKNQQNETLPSSHIVSSENFENPLPLSARNRKNCSCRGCDLEYFSQRCHDIFPLRSSSPTPPYPHRTKDEYTAVHRAKDYKNALAYSIFSDSGSKQPKAAREKRRVDAADTSEEEKCFKGKDKSQRIQGAHQPTSNAAGAALIATNSSGGKQQAVMSAQQRDQQHEKQHPQMQEMIKKGGNELQKKKIKKAQVQSISEVLSQQATDSTRRQPQQQETHSDRRRAQQQDIATKHREEDSSQLQCKKRMLQESEKQQLQQLSDQQQSVSPNREQQQHVKELEQQQSHVERGGERKSAEGAVSGDIFPDVSCAVPKDTDESDKQAKTADTTKSVGSSVCCIKVAPPADDTIERSSLAYFAVAERDQLPFAAVGMHQHQQTLQQLLMQSGLDPTLLLDDASYSADVRSSLPSSCCSTRKINILKKSLRSASSTGMRDFYSTGGNEELNGSTNNKCARECSTLLSEEDPVRRSSCLSYEYQSTDYEAIRGIRAPATVSNSGVSLSRLPTTASTDENFPITKATTAALPEALPVRDQLRLASHTHVDAEFVSPRAHQKKQIHLLHQKQQQQHSPQQRIPCRPQQHQLKAPCKEANASCSCGRETAMSEYSFEQRQQWRPQEISKPTQVCVKGPRREAATESKLHGQSDTCCASTTAEERVEQADGRKAAGFHTGETAVSFEESTEAQNPGHSSDTAREKIKHTDAGRDNQTAGAADEGPAAHESTAIIDAKAMTTAASVVVTAKEQQLLLKNTLAEAGEQGLKDAALSQQPLRQTTVAEADDGGTKNVALFRESSSQMSDGLRRRAASENKRRLRHCLSASTHTTLLNDESRLEKERAEVWFRLAGRISCSGPFSNVVDPTATVGTSGRAPAQRFSSDIVTQKEKNENSLTRAAKHSSLVWVTHNKEPTCDTPAPQREESCEYVIDTRRQRPSSNGEIELAGSLLTDHPDVQSQAQQDADCRQKEGLRYDCIEMQENYDKQRQDRTLQQDDIRFHHKFSGAAELATSTPESPFADGTKPSSFNAYPRAKFDAKEEKEQVLTSLDSVTRTNCRAEEGKEQQSSTEQLFFSTGMSMISSTGFSPSAPLRGKQQKQCGNASEEDAFVNLSSYHRKQNVQGSCMRPHCCEEKRGELNCMCSFEGDRRRKQQSTEQRRASSDMVRSAAAARSAATPATSPVPAAELLSRQQSCTSHHLREPQQSLKSVRLLARKAPAMKTAAAVTPASLCGCRCIGQARRFSQPQQQNLPEKFHADDKTPQGAPHIACSRNVVGAVHTHSRNATSLPPCRSRDGCLQRSFDTPPFRRANACDVKKLALPKGACCCQRIADTSRGGCTAPTHCNKVSRSCLCAVNTDCCVGRCLDSPTRDAADRGAADNNDDIEDDDDDGGAAASAVAPSDSPLPRHQVLRPTSAQAWSYRSRSGSCHQKSEKEAVVRESSRPHTFIQMKNSIISSPSSPSSSSSKPQFPSESPIFYRASGSQRERRTSEFLRGAPNS